MKWGTWTVCGLLFAKCLALSNPAAGQLGPLNRNQYPPFAAKQKSGREPFTGYHRYRGTIGEQRVTVELEIGPDPAGTGVTSCTGTCRIEGRPAELHNLHSREPYDARQPLQLVETDSAGPALRVGWWQAAQPVGPQLSGTWTSASGVVQPFALREDYHDEEGQLATVPYRMVSEEVVKVDGKVISSKVLLARWAAWQAGGQPVGEPRAILGRQFLHFTGPVPAISQIQCPPPAERRAQVLAEMRESGMEQVDNLTENPITREDSNWKSVLYQGEGLLCWLDNSYYYSGGAHGGHSISFTVYDLNAGELLSVTDLLRPGAARALCHLLTWHLQTEQDIPAEELRQVADYAETLAPLPESGFAIVAEGLYFQCTDYEIVGYAGGMPDVTIRWAELLPLLRPDSPVARMLRKRALWPPGSAQ